MTLTSRKSIGGEIVSIFDSHCDPSFFHNISSVLANSTSCHVLLNFIQSSVDSSFLQWTSTVLLICQRHKRYVDIKNAWGTAVFGASSPSVIIIAGLGRSSCLYNSSSDSKTNR